MNMQSPKVSTALLLLTCAGLTGCAGATLSPVEEAQAAEAVAATVIARVYPGIRVDPLANCVSDNATPAELTTLASYRDGVIGNDAQVLTLQIIDRPATDACARANGLILN